MQLFDQLTDIFKPMNDSMHELAAIWVADIGPIQTDSEKTVRIVPGMRVRIENDKLVDGTPGDRSSFTHRVLSCLGTIGDSHLKMILLDLKTFEPYTLHLKP